MPQHQAEQALPLAFTAADLAALKLAHQHLEHPSLAVRLSAVVGTPIEIGFKLLPAGWYGPLHSAFEKSLHKALDTAILSLEEQPLPGAEASKHFHRALGMASGWAGGLFGLPALAVEMPLMTTIMLRSIADIARSQGENLNDPRARLAMIEVFALGGRVQEDDAAETGYYGVRLALSLTLRDASAYLLEHGFKGEAAPLLVSFIHAVAKRFGVSLSHKAAAQAMPLLGAVGGMAINMIFLKHFQDMAWSHFTLRRLERQYGENLVQAQYELLSR